MEFLILPDSAAAQTWVAGIVDSKDEVGVIRHASGRPWIIGRWSATELTWAAVGNRQLAVLGCTTASAADLAAALGRVQQVGGLDELARRLPGSFHLIASINGTVRAQGSISTAYQIFYATVGPVTVAANRPDRLAALTGAGIAEEMLALRLLTPYPPYPLDETCVWRGVVALPLGHYLHIDADGRGHPKQWWTPPAPQTPLAEGVQQVRSRLHDAVAARTRPGGLISADLSGGMDSTSMCFLAATGSARLVTLHCRALDAGNDDQVWADRAAAAMPGAEHLVLLAEQVPPMFAGLTEPDTDVEAPLPLVRVRAEILSFAQVLADKGSTRHLTGDGGDELFFASPPFLHTLARRHPLAAVRKLRVDRSLHRWKLGATLRSIFDNCSYPEWMAATTRSLSAPLPKPSLSPDIGWDTTVRMPSWATDQAVDTVRQLLQEATDTQPMSPLRSQHSQLHGIRKGGDATRRTGRLTSGFQVAWHAPYLDDQVLEAALAIRTEDWAAQDGYKPVLVAAMRGIVPDHILARSTKAEFSQRVYAGLQHAQPQLLELAQDMELARLGLVDADTFRAALVGLYPNSRGLLFFDPTLACEVWLRSVRARTPATISIGGA